MALPAELSRALDVVAVTPRLLVVSDFDGTLAPIVNDPAAARALPAAADALLSLAECPSTTVALVSGRALAVLRELSAMPAVVHLIGSHGAEFAEGFTHDVDEAKLARVTAELRKIAAEHRGVTIEAKPASVALHVRNADAAHGESALAAARTAAQGWDVETTEGKAVIEFAVITTGKGEAVDVLRDQVAATAVVFLGDDVTDEKAFHRMRDSDIGIKVGPGDTAAGFRVDSPEDVAEVLAQLCAARHS